MLISGIVSKDTKTARKGDPIPMTAEQALDAAILRGIKEKYNSPEKTYWVGGDSVVATMFRKTTVDKKTSAWSATASGTVNIGYHDNTSDRSHVAKPHNFSIEYKSGEDANGLPDIAIVSFLLEPVTADASKLDISRYEQAKPAVEMPKKKSRPLK